MQIRSILIDSNSTSRFHSFTLQIKEFFTTPIVSRQQFGVILFLALFYIFIPQKQPIDWDLYNENYWSAGLNAYADPTIVSPPWAFILMVPYYLMRAEGARVFSVLVIGWLSYHRSWSLSKFLAIILSPFFLVTMSKSNMDILVMVFPILLWEIVQGTRWQPAGRGLALSLLLLKPQGTLLIWLYLLWTSRDDWRGLVKPLMIVALLIIPISMIGSPPLILQWANNLINPDPQNAFYWSINNMSLSNYFSPITATMVLLISFSALYGVMKWNRKRWCKGHTVASLLLISMFLSPYASQQSFSSALAFIPSWASFFTQSIVLIASIKIIDYWAFIPLMVLLIGISSLYYYQPAEKRERRSSYARIKVS
jgi:hypothetical protein